MGSEMTQKERMKAALTGKEADRIPVAPDISFMVPCKLTGKPFADVLLRNNPPLWKAYIDAVDYYDFDGWFTYSDIMHVEKREYTVRKEEKTDSDGNIYVTQIIDTPKGELKQVTYYPPDNSDTPVEKYVKDFKEDIPKLKYLFPYIDKLDTSVYDEQVKAFGDRGIMAVNIFPPGMHIFFSYVNGMDILSYAYYDYPEIFEEFTELYTNYQMRRLELILDLKPDSILTGGSGSITLASPSMWDKITFPVIKKITKWCKEAGVISGIHSCGKEMHIIKRCAEETCLDYINPIEIPPMGDSDLATAKKLYGDKISLMGNLHTTDIMLNGTVNDVRRESLRAILDAGIGGGFCLSTGDQAGRDTPEENLRAMIETCKKFGTYPLNVDKIKEELRLLQ